MSDATAEDQRKALDRFRVAMKFSLWTWALYWPAGGILLLVGGLNVVSVLVVLASFLAFILLLMTGVLSTEHSRNMKEFFLERPLYLIGIVAVLAIITPFVAPLVTASLILFASVYLGAMVFALTRLVQYYRLVGKPFMQSGVDQVFIALGLAGFAAFIIFLDSWVDLLSGTTVSGPAATVAITNWVSLLYPGMLLLATRGIRDPLKKPRLFGRKDKESEKAPAIAANTES